MDVSSITASIIAAQAGAIQQAVAMKMLKMNLAAENSVVQLLTQPQQASSSASLPAGVGGNLDISA